MNLIVGAISIKVRLKSTLGAREPVIVLVR